MTPWSQQRKISANSFSMKRIQPHPPPHRIFVLLNIPEEKLSHEEDRPPGSPCDVAHVVGAPWLPLATL